MLDWPNIIGRSFESKNLDYKAATTWDESHKKPCCELVKDILAMANTGGGWIVVGVSETDSGFSQDGVTNEQARSFETTRVNKFLNNYADPPINTMIHKPMYDKKTFVVIEVPGFPDTPHVCQKDFPDVLTAPTIYVRTDNNESAPLKSSADFRAVIEKSIRNRSDQMLRSFRTILTQGVRPAEPSDLQKFQEQIDSAAKRCEEINPHKEADYGYRESRFFPARFDENRFELATLKAMAMNASVDFRGWPFMFISEMRPDLTYAIEDGYETVLTEQRKLNGEDELHFWQLRQSGLLFVKQVLREDTSALATGNSRFLDFYTFSMSTAEAVHCLVKLYEGQLDDSEEVVLRFSLTGMENRPLGSSNPYRHIGPSMHTCHTKQITYEDCRPLADWRAGLIDHALAICEYVFQRFNWENPNLHESRKLIEKMLERKL